MLPMSPRLTKYAENTIPFKGRDRERMGLSIKRIFVFLVVTIITCKFAFELQNYKYAIRQPPKNAPWDSYWIIRE